MSDITLSRELKAMAVCETALAELDEAAMGRVLRWVAERFGVEPAGGPNPIAHQKGTVAPKGEPAGIESNRAAQGATDVPDYGSVAELYDAARPSTDAEKALVVSYWKQFVQGAQDVEAMAVNNELKHFGHSGINITRAFETLKNEKPSLVIQTRKEGATKQARKKFKVTTLGKRRVEEMLAAPRA